MAKESDSALRFNGRTIRLFLRERLRRPDFPRVILKPGRAACCAALEAADRLDFQPLVDIHALLARDY